MNSAAFCMNTYYYVINLRTTTYNFFKKKDFLGTYILHLKYSFVV